MAQLVVVAENQERKLAERIMPGVPVLECGVGALNIMQALRNIPLDTEIINIGYVGSSNFEIGTQVEIGECRLYHPNVTYPEPVFHLAGDTLCFTGVDFVLESKERDCVFDMELAFICGMGFRSVRSIKIVSDNLSLHEYHQVGAGV
ncbi:MAG: hypothetical protein ACI3Z5_03255 [Paludibacteraceae bacterium]